MCTKHTCVTPQQLQLAQFSSLQRVRTHFRKFSKRVVSAVVGMLTDRVWRNGGSKRLTQKKRTSGPKISVFWVQISGRIKHIVAFCRSFRRGKFMHDIRVVTDSSRWFRVQCSDWLFSFFFVVVAFLLGWWDTWEDALILFVRHGD